MQDAMAAFGLCAEGEGAAAPDEKCYLWPCNLPAWNLWQSIQTQWREGMQGRTGLDYAAVTAYMRDVLRIRHKRFAEMFSAIRAMEVAALNTWAEQRGRQ